MAYEKPTDSEVQSFLAGRPFKRCDLCGKQVGPNRVRCTECTRLAELGMNPQEGWPTDQSKPMSNPPSDHGGFRKVKGVL